MSHVRRAMVAASDEPSWEAPEREQQSFEFAGEENPGAWWTESPRDRRPKFDLVSEEDAMPHRIHPVWELETLGERVRFRGPLAVVIEESDSECIVSNSALNVWGLGPSKYRALEDFAQTLVAVLRSYEGTPQEQLSEDAQDYVAFLTGLIESREAL